MGIEVIITLVTDFIDGLVSSAQVVVTLVPDMAVVGLPLMMVASAFFLIFTADELLWL